VRFRIAIVLLVALLITSVMYARLPGNRDTGTFDTNPPAPYTHYLPTGTSRGRVLAVHGLNSNRHVMNMISLGLSDAGFEVFAIDLPGHGESPAPFNAIAGQQVVEQVFDRLGPQTIVVGHSFGGGLLLDMANDRPVTQMVLFSPAPVPLQKVQAERVLVFEGQFDPPAFGVFGSQIPSAVTGSFELRNQPWTGHSGGLFRERSISYAAQWLGGDASAIRTTSRLVLLALRLFFSLALGVVLIGLLTPSGLRPGAGGLVYYILAGLLATMILAVVNVVAWIHIFATDYLIGILFLVGVLLLYRCNWMPPQKRGLCIALLAAAYLIAVPGIFASSELFQTVLSGSRWWRFPAIFALGLPIFYVDEVLLRGHAVTAIFSRILLGAIAVSGALIINREAAFILLLTHAAVAFWILLWFLTGLVRKRTDAFSAACFASVIQAWFFAALFVMT
jgi:pimeloyl-ACP methyl ester carboxylesterase